MEVGGFDVDRVVGKTRIQVHIDIHKHDLGGGGLPSEFDRIEVTEVFKKLGEGVETMRSETSSSSGYVLLKVLSRREWRRKKVPLMYLMGFKYDRGI